MNDKQITIHNLKILRDAWAKQDFDPDMRDFGGIDNDHKIVIEVGKTNDCGTDCCALGFAPSVKGLEVESSDFTHAHFDYDSYSDRLFPLLENQCFTWGFLFGGFHPDSREAFLERINYAIDNDLENLDDFTYSKEY